MDDDLDAMSRGELLAEVKRLRAGIRAHKRDADPALDDHLPALRPRQARVHAWRRVPGALRVRVVQGRADAEGRRMLRVLQLRRRALPAGLRAQLPLRCKNLLPLGLKLRLGDDALRSQ